MSALPADIRERLAAEVAKHAAERGIVVAGPLLGSSVTLDDGRVLAGTLRWRNVAADEASIVAAARLMIDAIADEHGPGRVRCLNGLVHMAEDDGVTVMLDYDDRPACRLRAYYGHEAEAR